MEVPEDLEGTSVTILAPGAEGYTPSPEEERELTAALTEIRSGNFVEADDLLRELEGLGG